VPGALQELTFLMEDDVFAPLLPVRVVSKDYLHNVF